MVNRQVFIAVNDMCVVAEMRKSRALVALQRSMWTTSPVRSFVSIWRTLLSSASIAPVSCRRSSSWTTYITSAHWPTCSTASSASITLAGQCKHTPWSVQTRPCPLVSANTPAGQCNDLWLSRHRSLCCVISFHRGEDYVIITVCLSFCVCVHFVSVQDNSRSCGRIWMKFSLEAYRFEHCHRGEESLGINLRTQTP